MKVRNKYKFGKTSTGRKDTTSKYLQITANRALKCSPIDFGVPWMGGRRSILEQKDSSSMILDSVVGFLSLLWIIHD